MAIASIADFGLMIADFEIVECRLRLLSVECDC